MLFILSWLLSASPLSIFSHLSRSPSSVALRLVPLEACSVGRFVDGPGCGWAEWMKGAVFTTGHPCFAAVVAVVGVLRSVMVAGLP